VKPNRRFVRYVPYLESIFPFRVNHCIQYQQRFIVKHTSKKLSKKASVRNEEQVKLELLNLAVMFRSDMIGKDEFESRARSMGISKPLDLILEELPLPQLI